MGEESESLGKIHAERSMHLLTSIPPDLIYNYTIHLPDKKERATI